MVTHLVAMFDMWQYLGQNLWLVASGLIMMAVICYIAANITMRKINTRVIYHKSGGTVNVLKMRETEDRVVFRTSPDPLTRKAEEITVTKYGDPEIQVTGLKTFRMFHVVEDYGRTVDIRDIVKGNPRSSGRPTSTAFAAMATAFELMQKTAAKAKGDWIIIGVGLVAAFFAGLGWGFAF